MRTAAVAALVLALSLVATADAREAATTPAPGVWEAATPDGFLRFRVTSGVVRDLVVSYRCTADGGNLWSAFVSLPIHDGAVSSTGFTTLQASFRDATHARGSVAPSPGVGVTRCRAEASRPFTARKLRQSPVVPAAGRWVGEDAAGASLSFTVDARGLVREIRIAAATSCTTRAGLVPFAADAVIRPSTDRFSARSRPVGLDGAQAGRAEDLDGRFTSPRSARGTFRESTAGDRPCDSGAVAWTARPAP